MSTSIPPSRIPRLQPTIPSSSSTRRPSGNSSISDTSSNSDPQSSSSPKIVSGRPTISRPRSKSTLAPRPIVARSSSGSSQERNYPPSGIPIPVSRNRQRKRSNSASPSKTLGDTEYAIDDEREGEDRSEILAHKESFDLSRQAYPSTYLRDELPPFKLAPEEAMRIARDGHKINRDEEGDEDRETGEEDWDEGEEARKRKRIESMFPTKPTSTGAGVGRRKGSGDSRVATGMSRSATGSALGIGQSPSSRSTTTGNKLNSSQQRSTTGSNRSPLSTSQGSTSRSMSLGHSLNISSSTTPIPTPPRMGIAAHLVPPESAYTPPKGANWDEVVLPALARKMGEDSRVGKSDMEDGDLAVEWDRNGTPIKWVKKNPTTSRLGQSIDSSSAGKERSSLAEESQYNNIPRSGSSFSPSFEPSPDNPLHQSSIFRPPHTRDASTQSHESQPTPTPSPHRGGAAASSGLQPPIRTTNAYDTSFEDNKGPISPAPFSSFPRRPSTGPHALRNVDSIDSGLDNQAIGEGGLSRKPSFLRNQLSASRQTSNNELRMKGSSHSLRPVGQGSISENQGLSRPGDVAWERQRQAGQKQAGQGIPPSWEQPQPAGPPGGGVGKGTKGKEGEHGKGCGCVIM